MRGEKGKRRGRGEGEESIPDVDTNCVEALF